MCNKRFERVELAEGRAVEFERLTVTATPETLAETLEALYREGYGVAIRCMANGTMKLNAVKVRREGKHV